MSSRAHPRQQGYLMLAVMFVVFAIGTAVMLTHAGLNILAGTAQYSRTSATIDKLNDAILQFTALNHRLPCPAQPGPAASGLPAPNGASSNCTFPAGVVPWAVLGLKAEDALDEWGRLISYRVFDGPVGLTQSQGASALDCDLNNDSSPETPPTANGLCSTDHNTLAAHFLSYPAGSAPFFKGLKVNDFGREIKDTAFILISHGPTGLGGYPLGANQMLLPEAGAGDYQNTQIPGAAAYAKSAHSAKEVAPGTANHYDDVVSYMSITDLLTRTRLAARDWPESTMPSFTPDTTNNLTSPSNDPLRPHFMSSGTSGSGQEFVTLVSGGDVQLLFGSDNGSFAGCLWWPIRLRLVDGSARRSLMAYMEFAAIDNLSDSFPGFTLGFVSGSAAYGPPVNGICGTSIAATTTATGNAGEATIEVFSASGIQLGMNVSGAGIDPASLVANISGTTITLDRNTTAALANTTVEFSDSSRIHRDLGWAGGSLDTHFPNRFAIEFDASQSNTSPTANDPSRPHLAVDFGGVTHGTNAESCALTGSGLGCDTESTDFAAISKTATGSVGGTSILITDATGVEGIVHGMSVSGIGVGLGATVTGIAGNTVSLSVLNSGAVSGSLTFGSLSTSGFMLNGLGVFHSMRAEIYPRDCAKPVGSAGLTGATTVTVGDSSLIASGMSVYGTGVAHGAKVTGVSGTTISLTLANTGSVSGDLVFGGTVSPTTTATGNALENTIVVANPSGIRIGMRVSGTGIGNGATVTSFFGNAVALSVNNVAAVSGSLLIDAVSTTATGFADHSTIIVSDPTGISAGMLVSGTGIETGTTVSSVSGTTVTLSFPTSGSVSGEVIFRSVPTALRTLVKAWTLSNAGCNASPSTCAALQNINTGFTADISLNRQMLHSVSCIPQPTPSSSFETLYFGITSANRDLGDTKGLNMAFRRLFMTNTGLLP